MPDVSVVQTVGELVGAAVIGLLGGFAGGKRRGKMHRESYESDMRTEQATSVTLTGNVKDIVELIAKIEQTQGAIDQRISDFTSRCNELREACVNSLRADIKRIDGKIDQIMLLLASGHNPKTK